MGKDSLFVRDLDFVRFVRRSRMHGFGLSFLLGRSERSNSARLAFSRPLRALDTNEKQIQKT